MTTEFEETAKSTEAMLRAAFNTMGPAIILVDKAGRVQIFNASAGTIFGDGLKEGALLCNIETDEDIKSYNYCLNQAFAGTTFKQEKNIQIDADRSGWIELIYEPVWDHNQIIGATITAINIDERKKIIDNLAQQHQHLLEELESILVVNRALISKINLNHLLEFIITQAEHLVNACGAAVFLFGQDGQELVLASPGETWLSIPPGASFPLQNSLAELAIDSHQVFIRDYSLSDGGNSSIRKLLPATECITVMCAPLTVQDNNLGILLIWSDRHNAFSRHDSRLISLFADQAALALNNSNLYAQSRRLAIEQERHRLARELHDSVSQSLYSMGLAAESLLKLLGPVIHPEAKSRIKFINQLARSTLTEIRERLHNLHPSILDELGLIGALEQFCVILGKRYSTAIHLVPCQEPLLTTHHKEELYYIAREALWNAVKHANASQIQVQIFADPTQIIATVQDNGIGFDPTLTPIEETAGLRNMQERANFLKGTLEIRAAAGQGTSIIVQIPSIQESISPI